MYKHDQKNDEGHTTGQDILAKLTSLPFVYPTKYGGMSQAAYNTFKNIINSDYLANINIFPVKYILIRKDVICEDCLTRLWPFQAR